MKYALTDDQASVLAGLDQLLGGFDSAPPTEPVLFEYAAALDQTLAESGFLDIAREDGFSPLDAALIVERLARLPQVVEAAASSIVAPAVGVPAGTRPVALLSGPLTRAARYLPMARVLLADRGDHALMIKVEPDNVETVETLFAYPYGKLKSLDGLEQTRIEDVAALRRRWRIALAAEAAGCMASAIDAILEHVKTRQAFGQPLGAFQAIQHRLAMAAETAEATKYLAFRAAWSDLESDAAIAAGFAQTRTAQLAYDLHQFAGAMSLTLEFPLHLWTYRLRALAGELGGGSRQARAAALATWGAAA
ncbi:MAG TPA: acyl-CoA dehydrogenase family protein [Phenylobacterium sp.]|uniref:acyl-CoA dehydrogenase family protein n=1 Tax=Phenylobacterium sp. TaxID=1871053 RepID=UPI002B4866E9|nr:acyl-CoA dehydrogenase family protein [Phenylobacterium sp.]HKR87070.1 acyl-CoA dehydrogenase family protein [Phenylobacterium sp.]